MATQHLSRTFYIIYLDLVFFSGWNEIWEILNEMVILKLLTPLEDHGVQRSLVDEIVSLIHGDWSCGRSLEIIV